jgi:hypothetical protein
VLGNPYAVNQWSRQTLTFDIPDNASLDTTEPLVCTWAVGGMFHQSEKDNIANDIFLKDIQLIALMELPVVKGYHLNLVPNRGLTFTESIQEISLVPDLQLDGSSLSLKTKAAQCFWFVQDNSVQDSNNANYFAQMGARWRCLNSKNDEGVFVSDNGYKLTVKSENVLAAAEKYACLVIYDGRSYKQDIILEKFNNALYFDISADSDIYIADTGEVTLTAVSNYKPAAAETISFSWARYDKNGNFIDSHWWEKEETSEDLTKNKITFPTIKIDDKNTFSCSLVSIVDGVERVIATTQYNIVVESDPTVRLVTYDSNVLYKYDANGISPFNPSYNSGLSKSSLTLKPITFKLFKPDGEELTEAEYATCQWTWKVPENTMLKLSDKEWVLENGFYTSTARNCTYDIRNNYSANRTDNTIILSVVFNEMIYTQNCEIQFMKDGANGTNGTDYVASIVYEGQDRIIVR